MLSEQLVYTTSVCSNLLVTPPATVIHIIPVTGCSNIDCCHSILKSCIYRLYSNTRKKVNNTNQTHVQNTIVSHCTLNLTLSLRSVLAPAVSRDCAMATYPLSAAKKRADQPVLCGGGGGGGVEVTLQSSK